MAKRPGILWFVLDEESAAQLRTLVPARFEKTWYHHITLRYGVERYEVAAIIGQRHQIEAYAVAFNDQAQAVRVETNGLPDEYGVPHITLSTTAAVKPFASVAMLKGGHDESKIEPPIALNGTVEFTYIDQVKE
jgi:hypothetical protein